MYTLPKKYDYLATTTHDPVDNSFIHSKSIQICLTPTTLLDPYVRYIHASSPEVLSKSAVHITHLILHSYIP